MTLTTVIEYLNKNVEILNLQSEKIEQLTELLHNEIVDKGSSNLLDDIAFATKIQTKMINSHAHAMNDVCESYNLSRNQLLNLMKYVKGSESH